MSTDAPECPKCGRPMQRVVSLPRLGELPAVEGFYCEPCDEEVTREVE